MTLIWTYGVRNTTLLTLLAFLVVGVARRRPAALLAMAAWLVGFEALWQWTYIAMSALDPHMWKWQSDGWNWAPSAVAAAGLAVVVVTRLAGLRADRWWVLATAALWLLWMATGLHANYPGRPFDVPAEVINVAVKTAWALAYLVPLARGAAPGRPRAVVRSAAAGFETRAPGRPRQDRFLISTGRSPKHSSRLTSPPD